MRRFLAFPLLLGVMGALFPLIAYEGILSVATILLKSGGAPFSPPPDIVLALQQSTLWASAFGVFIGLVAALFDLVLNRRKRRDPRQLVGNIGWCFLYGQAIIAVNGLIVFWVQWAYAGAWWHSTLKDSILSFFPFLPLFIHFVAVSWGTIRTITTENVLTPHVLRSKLKRSTNVET